MSRARLTKVILVAGAVAVSSLVPAPAQAAAVVGCGSVLTTDTTLTADVLNCVGDGLLIGADGITLDLDGHVVGGDLVEDPTDVGIRVSGHQGVTVTNGTVQGFWRGVVFEASPSGVVSSMTTRLMTRRGIVVRDGSDDAQVVGNISADNQASGISIVTSDGASVFDNQSLRNIGGAGVRLEGATDATVTRNALNGNSFGMQLEDAVGNRVFDNTIAGDVEVGVETLFSSGNVIEHNRITRTNFGVVLVGADDNAITGNQVLHPVGPDGSGIQIYGNHNLVAGNTVIDWVNSGIEVFNYVDAGTAVGNVIRDNVVNGGTAGIAIGSQGPGAVLDTLILHNVVTGSDDDGIQIVGPGTGLATSTVIRNVAVRNGDLGIEAVPGTIDGGGNHAAGNGNKLQCLNVACR